MLERLKRHWFGYLITLMIVFYTIIFTLVMISPRQDSLNRGFVPCTKEMISQMMSCQDHKAWCMSKAIIQNTGCDTLVILDGLGAFIKGNQKTPWENYLFTPEIETPDIDTDLEQYYNENPMLKEEMERLKEKHLELEKKLEEIKNDELPQ